MSDQDEGTSAQAGADAVDEQTLCLRVEGGRRLVEQEDAARAEKAAGDGDALCLAFAEAGSVFAAEGVKTVREVVHEFCDCGVQCVAQLFVGCVGFADKEVIADGAAYECVALRHIDDVATCSGRGLYLFFAVVVHDSSLVREEEGEHDPDHCALADAGLSDDGCHAAWPEVVTEPFEDVPVSIRIGKRHVAEAYAELAVEADRLAFFFLRKVEFAEAVDRGDRMYEGRYLLGYLGDRSLDLSHELEEGGHGSEGDGSGCDACYSPREGGDISCGEAEGYHRAGKEVVVVAVDGLLLEVFLIFSEGVDGLSCALER